MKETTRNCFASLPWWRVRSRCVGHAARITVLCALLCAPVLAAEDDVSDRGDPAIPPGQEELVAAMLGKGEALPGGCALAGGGADHTLIKAVYACPSGEVVFELDHPSTAAATATQTANFAVTLQDGTPPNSLADTLVSLIRSREADFEWAWPGAEDKAARGDDAGEDDTDDAD